MQTSAPCRAGRPGAGCQQVRTPAEQGHCCGFVLGVRVAGSQVRQPSRGSFNVTHTVRTHTLPCTATASGTPCKAGKLALKRILQSCGSLKTAVDVTIVVLK